MTLLEKLDIEKNIINWLPYKRIYYHKLHDGTLQEQQCPERNPAINEFPPGIWTRKYFSLTIIVLFFQFSKKS